MVQANGLPTENSSAGSLLRVDELRVEFDTPGGRVEAVAGVTFEVPAGRTVAVVGESGSGKSATALAMLGLLDGGGVSGGEVHWDGVELTTAPAATMRRVRGNDIAMIFQDPMTSLDPLYPVGAQIVEAIRLHRKVTKRSALATAVELLAKVGLPDPEARVRAYPHELSGGQRQRVMIAIALACEPRLLIADEPTTALDVTIEAQVLELIRELQREYHTALLLITHDLGVVAEMADWVVVLYAGQVVEQGPTAEILASPRHPYTSALLAAIPTPETDKTVPLAAVDGAVPSLFDIPAGCRFHPRCAHAYAPCGDEPPVFPLGGGRQSRCWLREQDAEGAGQPVVHSGRGGTR